MQYRNKELMPLTCRILETMNLSQDQTSMLFDPIDKKLENSAIDSIAEFIVSSQRLFICGDYDCDGVCSTSIAMLLANKVNTEAGFYISNRLTEGYGAQAARIQQAYERGYTDVLMIDNGVKAFAAIDRAHELGMRVAIVDHHLIEEPVHVEAFLHPDVCEPYGHSMCASGLIYAVAEAMNIADDYMLALAGIATIADVMPLWGKNRELVRRAITVLNSNQFLQIDLLVKRTRFTVYSSKLIAFQVVPKVNTVGRLADIANVNTAVTYFISQDHALITSYAKQMHSLNDFRKKEAKKLKEHALLSVTDDPIQIIVDENYHEGLLGIVANQIAQVTEKPTIVLRQYDAVLKGSARSMSLSLADLFGALDPKYFEAMGGHDFAFGMTLNRTYFESFKDDVQAIGAEYYPESDKTNKYLDVQLSEINPRVLQELRMFEPYGAEFELPLMKMTLPNTFRVANLNGYGFKLIFDGEPIDEAVFFTQRYTRYDVESMRTVSMRFDLDEHRKCVIFIEDII